MTWVKMDDQYPDHPKVEAAGPLAAWLNVCAWAYASRFLTDGFIPDARVTRLAAVPNASTLAERLVEVGLWERVAGGYCIHDYLTYNPSAEQVREERDGTAERKRRWLERRNAVSNGVSNTVRNAVRNAVRNGVSTAAPARPVPSGLDGVPQDAVHPSAHSARARDPGATASRVAPTEDDEATSGQFSELRPGLKECPLCRQVFEGTYGDHLGSAPEHANIGQHRLRPGRPRRSAAERLTPIPPEVLQELDAVALERATRHVELPPDVLAEHERLLSLERSAREQPPPPSNGVSHTPAVPKPTRHRKKRQEA